jgi:hypothetical protein
MKAQRSTLNVQCGMGSALTRRELPPNLFASARVAQWQSSPESIRGWSRSACCYNYKRRFRQGSSAVEQGTHKPLVGSSILPSGRFFMAVSRIAAYPAAFERRRREGLKPGVKRSETPGAESPTTEPRKGWRKTRGDTVRLSPVILSEDLQKQNAVEESHYFSKWILRRNRSEMLRLRSA